jgi:hypothetical protein
LILRSVGSSRSPRVTHFTMSGPHTNVWRAGPHTNCRTSRRFRRPRESGRARCGHIHISSKIAELPTKALPAADLRGSTGPPRVTHSPTDRRIKLRRSDVHPAGGRADPAWPAFCMARTCAVGLGGRARATAGRTTPYRRCSQRSATGRTARWGTTTSTPVNIRPQRLAHLHHTNDR